MTNFKACLLVDFFNQVFLMVDHEFKVICTDGVYQPVFKAQNKLKSIKIFLICSSQLRPLPTKEIELVGAADGPREQQALEQVFDIFDEIIIIILYILLYKNKCCQHLVSCINMTRHQLLQIRDTTNRHCKRLCYAKIRALHGWIDRIFFLDSRILVSDQCKLYPWSGLSKRPDKNDSMNHEQGLASLTSFCIAVLSSF
ncbi:hypothetical protein BCV71DRAFT_232646 [Rhizopus microsporus]|uniref:Uncharacterized protein n=1 Tax=Rhizopus microsporus TaxID=58291 RepID=A0A1X0S9K9_RHIZD|nr:hypothetical protein BCV71DRAFT_232646 [Rhizopus microsporus]